MLVSITFNARASGVLQYLLGDVLNGSRRGRGSAFIHVRWVGLGRVFLARGRYCSVDGWLTGAVIE